MKRKEKMKGEMHCKKKEKKDNKEIDNEEERENK